MCAGDKERAGRKILKDYQTGALGAFALEQVPRAGEEAAAARDYKRHADRGSLQRGALWQAPRATGGPGSTL